jgi:hypothetical protein
MVRWLMMKDNDVRVDVKLKGMGTGERKVCLGAANRAEPSVYAVLERTKLVVS